ATSPLGWATASAAASEGGDRPGDHEHRALRGGRSDSRRIGAAAGIPLVNVLSTPGRNIGLMSHSDWRLVRAPRHGGYADDRVPHLLETVALLPHRNPPREAGAVGPQTERYVAPRGE